MRFEENNVMRLTTTTTTTTGAHINSFLGGTPQKPKRTYHLMQGDGAGRRYTCLFSSFYIFSSRFSAPILDYFPCFGWLKITPLIFMALMFCCTFCNLIEYSNLVATGLEFSLVFCIV